MTHHKKKAAAISAVVSYIKFQEEAAAWIEPASEAISAVDAPTAPAAGIGGPPLWGLSGRQQQMQMRNLMQMRALYSRGGWRR